MLGPVSSLLLAEVEKPIGVFIFRCRFMHSVYEVRGLIIHDTVLLSGKVVR